MEKQYYVYILASKRNGTLYTGVTSDIVKRVWQHKNNMVAFLFVGTEVVLLLRGY